MPNGAKSDWVWISQESATPTNILLALLRASKAPIRAREVIAQVHEIQPAVLRGSINNIGSRLGGKTIGRTKDGWRLINPDAAGIIHAGYLWGPREILFKTELAAHRREAILHVLGFFQSGLQLRQILEQLKRCPWVRAPLSKDLLKADLELLNEAKKIRKRGKSGKWEIVSTDEDPTTGNTP